ncbi:MAG TPA: hypothetical protein VGP82_20600 [Ktedonobacterales bacterium]|nr:hypothetical protein [Ktedonobacterales bacterium]
MRAYSTDLKERLVRAVAEGLPMRAAARRFGVAVTTVKRAVVQQREPGSLERKPIPGCSRRIGPDQEAQLRGRPPAAPEATVLEHCAWWAEQYGQELSEAPLWRGIRRLGWTHKKTTPANFGGPVPRLKGSAFLWQYISMLINMMVRSLPAVFLPSDAVTKRAQR